MRSGSIAKELLATSDENLWNEAFEKYESVVVALSNSSTKKQELVALDQWLWKSYPNEVSARSQKYINKDELTQIMKWKLMRGKFRPTLLGLIGQNTSAQVESISMESIAALDSGDWETALKILTNLRGVGPGMY
jgi:hypothetical protein